MGRGRMANDLRQRLVDAKLAGRKSPGGPEGVYAYYFRSNEQAADAALAALGQWVKDEMALHDDIGVPLDVGYMEAVGEILSHCATEEGQS